MAVRSEKRKGESMKRMNMSVILSCLLTLMVLSGGGRGTETGMVLRNNRQK